MASAAARHTVANYSLKRTAADGLRYHHAHCGSGRLAQALGLEIRFFSCVPRSPQRLVLRFAHCSCSAFSLLLSLGCAGLRVALGSSTWRARKIMRLLLAD